MTMITQSIRSSKNVAVTVFSVNFSGYVVVHVTIDECLLSYYCMLFSSRVRVRVACSVRFIGDYAHIFILLSAVISTLPGENSL